MHTAPSSSQATWLGKAFVVAIAIILFVFGSRAQAEVVINFEQFVATDSNITELQFTQEGIGVRIFRLDGTSFRLANSGFSRFDNVSLSPFNGLGGAAIDSPFVFEFSVPILSLSVMMGDWGEDADSLLLVGYEGPGLTGTSASITGSLSTAPNNTFTMMSLSLQAPEPAGFRAFTMQGGGTAFPNSVFYDNISITAVPEPASVGLLSILGMIAVGTTIYKRQRLV